MMFAFGVTLLIAALIVLSWLWRPRQPMEGGVRLLIMVYALFGIWSLFFTLFAPDAEPDFFAIWKPTFFLWTLAAVLIMSPMFNMGYPVKAVFGTYFALGPRQWRWMNAGFAALFAVLGGVNLQVAFSLSEGNWEGFKYSYLIVVMMIVLMRLNFVWAEIVARVVVYLYRRAKSLWP
jgi:intracellular septation protein